MNIEEYRAFCLGLKGSSESTPFGEDTLVLKVLTKVYAIFDIELFASINLKCEPQKAIELREKYDFIVPGYHMNKKHWNSVLNPSYISDDLLKEFTLESYNLVIEKMTKKEKDLLKGFD